MCPKTLASIGVRELSTPSLGITWTDYSIQGAGPNTNLSTPSLGITLKRAADPDVLATAKLSTPSLGITVSDRRVISVEPDDLSTPSLGITDTDTELQKA